MVKREHNYVCFIPNVVLTDVAIGAPYEDDWTGAVYVYNGYKGGLWDMYSQKIVARQLDSGLRAFGHAISKSMDVNSDDIKGL